MTNNLQSGVNGIIASLRIPTLIGTADEIQQVNGYELVRGSSATQDNKITGEILSPVNGTNTIFKVQNYPIVTGSGLGIITISTTDVQVFDNGASVIVARVDGLNGLVYLALPPAMGDTVTINYFYKRTDTKITDEVLSDQVDGVTTTFYTHHLPIVDGTNAGRPTTTISNIIVKDNGAIVSDVSSLDGMNGNFTLSSPVLAGHTLTVTYYFNAWANTSDDLPYIDETLSLIHI